MITTKSVVSISTSVAASMASSTQDSCEFASLAHTPPTSLCNSELYISPGLPFFSNFCCHIFLYFLKYNNFMRPKKFLVYNSLQRLKITRNFYSILVKQTAFFKTFFINFDKRMMHRCYILYVGFVT